MCSDEYNSIYLLYSISNVTFIVVRAIIRENFLANHKYMFLVATSTTFKAIHFIWISGITTMKVQFWMQFPS